MTHPFHKLPPGYLFNLSPDDPIMELSEVEFSFSGHGAEFLAHPVKVSALSTPKSTTPD
jgi:hypothetical protein